MNRTHICVEPVTHHDRLAFVEHMFLGYTIHKWLVRFPDDNGRMIRESET